MNDSRGAISPESLPRPGEVALLIAINAVLDVPADELPGRNRLRRELRPGLLRDHVLGVPVGPVRVGLADALLVFAVGD